MTLSINLGHCNSALCTCAQTAADERLTRKRQTTDTFSIGRLRGRNQLVADNVLFTELLVKARSPVHDFNMSCTLYAHVHACNALYLLQAHH